MHPLLYELALWSPEHQEKRSDYIIGTVYVAYYALSVIAGNIISVIGYGPSALKDCWNPKMHLLVIPSATILTFVEVR